MASKRSPKDSGILIYVDFKRKPSSEMEASEMGVPLTFRKGLSYFHIKFDFPIEAAS
jgi:hypothetical protein